MRQKKTNIQRINPRGDTIDIVITVIIGLFLFGSYSALFSYDTGNKCGRE